MTTSQTAVGGPLANHLMGSRLQDMTNETRNEFEQAHINFMVEVPESPNGLRKGVYATAFFSFLISRVYQAL